MSEEWSYEDDEPNTSVLIKSLASTSAGSGDTVKLRESLVGASGSSAGGELKKMFSSGEEALTAVRRLSQRSLESPMLFPVSPMGEEGEDEVDDDEDDEEQEGWRGGADKLGKYLTEHAPPEDSGGLFGAQVEAFRASVSGAASGRDYLAVLEQTVRNLVDLSVHLMARVGATENELLAAVGKLEERRARHEEVKGALKEKKAKIQELQSGNKRLERELEAAKLKAERAEMQAAIYEDQAMSLKSELGTATSQLEEMRRSSDGRLGAADAATLEKITLRGKGVASQVERQESQLALNVAALTAELEALELSPRPGQPLSAQEEEEVSEGASASDIGSPRGGVPRGPKGILRLRMLVNELVNDNDLLQKEYLDLLASHRTLLDGGAQPRSRSSSASRSSKKSLLRRTGSGNASSGEEDGGGGDRFKENELALNKAARMKAEALARTLLDEKLLLEAALVQVLKK